MAHIDRKHRCLNMAMSQLACRIIGGLALTSFAAGCSGGNGANTGSGASTAASNSDTVEPDSTASGSSNGASSAGSGTPTATDGSSSAPDVASTGATDGSGTAPGTPSDTSTGETGGATVSTPPSDIATGGEAGPNSGTLNPGQDEVLAFEPQGRASALRKVKNLMTGLAPTEEEYAVLAQVPATGDAAEAQALYEAMRSLVVSWLETPQFDKKLIALFRNVFQQKGFSMQEDMKGQFLEYGPFDLNPTFSYGDTAYTRFEKNFSDSFAQTALHLVKTGANFSEVLTTRTHMMTTALLAAYLQIEQPNDAPLQFALPRTDGPTWNIDRTRDIPIEEAVASMTFDDDAPSTGAGFLSADAPECDAHDYTGANGGSALLFQRLIGLTPRWNYTANPQCFEHPSKPYFETSDTEDWRLITFNEGAPTLKPWDIPALRALAEGSTVSLNLPRVGYYTTPAYLALWRTNDSNQHRVTANQTLIVALGQGFTSEQSVTPVTEVGLDEAHSAATPECYGCHKSLDPLRQFWENQFDYGDRNDFKDNQGTARGGFGFGGTATKDRPTTRGGALAFANVNAEGTNFDDLGPLMLAITDGSGMPRFALSMAQQLCYWADSAGCAEGDNEFRRVAQAFVDSNYNYKVLVTELLSSPLVTGFSPTATFESRNVTVSVTRRDHLCAALGNRLDLGDVCGLDYAFPQSQGFGGGQSEADSVKTVFRIAGTIAADSFSRGSEVPVTPLTPTLFYAAGSELFCEYVAGKAVGTLYQTSDIDGAIAAMVRDVMGYTQGETFNDGTNPAQAAATILRANYDEALAAQGSSATTALQSTFSLACQAPTSLGVGM